MRRSIDQPRDYRFGGTHRRQQRKQNIHGYSALAGRVDSVHVGIVSQAKRYYSGEKNG